MLGKNNSSLNYVTSRDGGLPGSSAPENELRFKVLILAFVAASVLLGLFFDRLAAANIIMALAIAAFVLVLVVGLIIAGAG